MQTILLQDDPDLFRGIEHSLLCREGIDLQLAAGEERLLAACRDTAAQVVLLAAGRSSAGMAHRLEALPHAPLCVTLPGDGGLGGMMATVRERLGLPDRKSPRHACHVPVKVLSTQGSCRGRTRDLSLMGAFIATETGCTLNGAVEIGFNPGRGEEGSRHRAMVVRRMPPDSGSDHLAGLAVCFAAGDGLSQHQLEKLMAQEPAVSS